MNPSSCNRAIRNGKGERINPRSIASTIPPIDECQPGQAVVYGWYCRSAVLEACGVFRLYVALHLKVIRIFLAKPSCYRGMKFVEQVLPNVEERNSRRTEKEFHRAGYQNVDAGVLDV